MKSLTVKELKALEVGDWVWIVALKEDRINKAHHGKYYNIHQPLDSLVEKELWCGWQGYSTAFVYADYGDKWIAYKNKEQAETKGELVELPCVIEVQDLDSVRYDIYFKRTKPPYKGSLDFYVRKTREEAEARLKELQERL